MQRVGIHCTLLQAQMKNIFTSLRPIGLIRVNGWTILQREGRPLYEVHEMRCKCHKECLIIVRNVPCYKCSECSEVIYTGDIVRKLEKIIADAKKKYSEISVIDYMKYAA